MDSFDRLKVRFERLISAWKAGPAALTVARAREYLEDDPPAGFASCRRSGNMRRPLFETIRQLVAAERYVVGQHASERLDERGILEWQAVAGLDDGELIVEHPDARPNPTIEVRETLPDGTEFKAVWSHLRQSGVAKLVTVHFFDWDSP